MSNPSFLQIPKTPVTDLGEAYGNHLFVKRDDLISYSFGGNKVRKAVLFFEEIDRGGYDTVVTYGSEPSNHCRVVASLAADRNLPCILITKVEDGGRGKTTNNERLAAICGARRIFVTRDEVHDAIEKTMEDLRLAGRHPYFVPAGGHGNPGTHAYVQCYREIREEEERTGTVFDRIFLASGTGTTQAGLVAGKLLHGDPVQIIGISIARTNPRGENIVRESVRSYLPDFPEEEINRAVIFDDGRILGGYGKADEKETACILDVWRRFGIPLDATYTGKAFYGMTCYLGEHGIAGENILFLHTGGAPLFFDDLAAGRLTKDKEEENT